MPSDQVTRGAVSRQSGQAKDHSTAHLNRKRLQEKHVEHNEEKGGSQGAKLQSLQSTCGAPRMQSRKGSSANGRTDANQAEEHREHFGLEVAELMSRQISATHELELRVELATLNFYSKQSDGQPYLNMTIPPMNVTQREEPKEVAKLRRCAARSATRPSPVDSTCSDRPPASLSFSVQASGDSSSPTDKKARITTNLVIQAIFGAITLP